MINGLFCEQEAADESWGEGRLEKGIGVIVGESISI